MRFASLAHRETNEYVVESHHQETQKRPVESVPVGEPVAAVFGGSCVFFAGMSPRIRKLLSWSWPILLLGAYFLYLLFHQYSRVPLSFSSFEDARQFAWSLKFPGTGLGFAAGTSDRPGESLRLYAVELLFRQKDRVFVVANRGGVFRTIDEFTSGPTIGAVELRQGKLQYLSHSGKVITEHSARE